MQQNNPTACLLIIGNEILSGRTQDKNLNYLAKKLSEHGVRLQEVRVIPDIEATIIATIRQCMTGFDYVFTTGGIGPTHDDITADCVAKAVGVGIGEHPAAAKILRDHYGDQITEARLRMARIPEGAGLIDNPISLAPGFHIKNIFVMAGVPSIMQAMLDNVLPMLRKGEAIQSVAVSAILPESRMAAGLAAIQKDHADIDIGSYPLMSEGKFATTIILRGTNKASINAAAEKVRAMMRGLGQEPIERDLAA
ncbi:competence/damage-inducible protein A [bacterium]|nr:competence/damage-inducible protein A [bacterium]